MHNVLAQLRNPVLPPMLGGGDAPDYQQGGTSLGKLISGLVGALFIAGFLLMFITLLLGALNWVTSGSDKAQMEKARDRITQALIGMMLVGAAWAITTIVAQFFGMDLTHLPVPTIGQ